MQLGVTVLFSLLNQPNQEAGLLLKCKFQGLRVNAPFAAQWIAVSLYSLKPLSWGWAAHNPVSLFFFGIHSLAREMCVRGCFDLLYVLAPSPGLEVVSGKSERYRLGRCSSGGFLAHQTEEGTGWRRRRLLPVVVTVMMCWCSAGPCRLAPLSLAPLSDRLVVFHQFFQSSIDSGLCISEARALWRWLWHYPDRKILSHDGAVHGNTKREAFVGNPCCF